MALAKQDKVVVFGGGSDIAKALKGLYRGETVLVPKSECNVTHYFDVLHVVQHNYDAVGFINCAGVCCRGSINLPGSLYRTIETNVCGSIIITSAISNVAIASGSRIIHISSMAGLKAKPDMVVYAASKAAIISMVKSVAKGGYDIYAIAPSIVNSKMNDGIIFDGSKIWQPADVAKEIIKCIEGKYKRGTIVRMEKKR